MKKSFTVTFGGNQVEFDPAIPKGYVLIVTSEGGSQSITPVGLNLTAAVVELEAGHWVKASIALVDQDGNPLAPPFETDIDITVPAGQLFLVPISLSFN